MHILILLGIISLLINDIHKSCEPIRSGSVVAIVYRNIFSER
jgi:hypothetical protein